MDEKQIERNLVKKAEKMGGRALKFVSPGLSGVPDRLVLLPGGHIGFVELKRPGEKMRNLQEKRKAQLESLGFLVFCLDSIDGAEEILNEIQTS
ncbi:VRR-NUC domain-containing protein [Butyrivibrio sp. FC2001]|uniref:VRR-NUC domain-containing protein n=1 Tax=Butyrivibrio sp. FC2001 TaxID=1280671 RepID=UPI00041C80BD|nr:VRR-NUC domain-containing protein [Butyrivibrio sp. FC2001]